MVGADLETETEMMRGEGRADDRLLRDDGRTHTGCIIFAMPWLRHTASYFAMDDLGRVYADLHGRLHLKLGNINKENP